MFPAETVSGLSLEAVVTGEVHQITLLWEECEAKSRQAALGASVESRASARRALAVTNCIRNAFILRRFKAGFESLSSVVRRAS